MKAMRSVLACIMVAVAVYLSGCATLGSEKVSFKPDIKGRLSARGQPAAVTQMSKAELFDQDYVSLGYLTVEQIIKVCQGYSDRKTGDWVDKGCKEKSPDADSTEVLLKRAAERGADLVRLTEDGAIRTERTYAIICDSYMSVPTLEFVCPPVGGAGCYTRTVYRQQCVSTHQETTGHLEKRESSGTIWRLDPLLARNQEFMYAAGVGDTDRLRKVLDGGYDIFTKDPAGETALHRAARDGHVDVIDIMISRGLPIDVRSMDGATPLMIAASAGRAGAAKALLGKGADVNAQFTEKDEDEGYTPLMFAVRYGNIGTVKTILAYRPDKNIRNGKKMTVLEVASQYISIKKDLSFTDTYVLLMAYTSGAYGYIDNTGKVLIPPMYIWAEKFSEGLGRVKVGNTWGYINKEGVMVIEPKFASAADFSEGRAAVRIGDKWGFIDKKGQIVIEPRFVDSPGLSYKGPGPFSDGRALVSVDEAYNRGYVDRSGKMVVEPIFFFAKDFSEGLAAVSEVFKPYGYIDKTGRFVIKPRFQSARNFSEGLAAVKLDGKWGFIDKTGKMVIEPQFEPEESHHFPLGFSEGMCAIESGGKWGFIDRTGQFAVKPQYKSVEPFSEGRAAVRIGDKWEWRFIDKKGRQVIPTKFERINNFSEGLAAVDLDGKWGYIDKTGRFVIKPQFDNARSFSEGLASVRATDESMAFLEEAIGGK